VKIGEVWSNGLDNDPSPWYYLVTEVDGDGIDMVLLDSDDDPDGVAGDRIELSWDDVAWENGEQGRTLWKRIG
jgi:hypothetical protein